MYEIVLTFRPDFTELVVERHEDAEDAHAAADRIASQRLHRVIRVWVRRRVRQANPTRA